MTNPMDSVEAVIADYDAIRESVGGCSDGHCVVKRPAGMHTNGGCRCSTDRFKAQRMMHAAQQMRDRLAALAPRQAEAVAWAYRSEDPYDAGAWLLSGPTWEGGETAKRPDRRDVIPLYTHPAPSLAGQREGDAFDSWWGASKYCQVAHGNHRQVALDGWNAALAATPAGKGESDAR